MCYLEFKKKLLYKRISFKNTLNVSMYNFYWVDRNLSNQQKRQFLRGINLNIVTAVVRVNGIL